MGRFINADAYASTGQGLLGNNMFAYCLNSPIVNVDNLGTIALSAICTVAIMEGGGYGTPKKPKPVVQTMLEHITSDETNHTVSVGITGGLSGFGPGIGGSVGVAVDTAYNYAGYSSDNYSVGTPAGASAMAGITFQITNADIVTDLGGVSKSYGFTVAGGLGIAVDIVHFVPASNPHTTSWGISVTIGFGIGLDIHASQSNTVVSQIWNPLKQLHHWLYGGN